MIRVGVNGFGVIGRRIADAVSIQSDMKLMGVVKVRPDYKATIALSKGYDVYCANERSLESFRSAGLHASGLAKQLLEQVDVVVDASPDETGRANKPIYEALGKKAIFQGGEDHELTGFSFVAQCNFDDGRGRRYVRVVSCNTTGLCRVLYAIDRHFGIEKARVVIARRAADPEETGKGPIDAVSLDPVAIPSHHGPDVNTVLPHLKIITMAIKIPTTHMHLHSLMLTLKNTGVAEDSVIEVLKSTPRVIMVSSKDGFTSTAHVVDYARELKRPRNDLYEVAVWTDSIKADADELYMYMGVHQEAIVIPENVDAIRVLSDGYSQQDSIRRTNQSLGIA